MKVSWLDEDWEDYVYWQAEHKRGTFYARRRQGETVQKSANRSLEDTSLYAYEFCHIFKQAVAD